MKLVIDGKPSAARSPAREIGTCPHCGADMKALVYVP